VQKCSACCGSTTWETDAAFAALQKALSDTAAATVRAVEEARGSGDAGDPIAFSVANRLFPQQDFKLRQEFLSRVKEFYGAPPEPLDYRRNSAAATQRINDWVAAETRDRIRDLIPEPLPADTRLVLANALYLKAPWAEEFPASARSDQPFHINGGDTAPVPTMRATRSFGYAKRDGYTAVAVPYRGGELQLLILLPDSSSGIAALEQQLSGEMLGALAQLSKREAELHLPKFRFEPPTMPLTSHLKELGMRRAFDEPPGSADFSGMAAPAAEGPLAVSDVFHKTFIALDEKGTEAAAATAVVMRLTSAPVEKPKPIVVKVDRPFVYAIQHVPSGVCLFIGRVTDPR
jgi:serpin B